MSGETPDDTHYAVVIDAIEKGRLIPFFGAGVNLCNRPDDYDWRQPWHPGSQFLPSGAELSKRLADRYKYPGDDWWNLLRVAQYVAAVSGETALDEQLQEFFDRDYPLTPLHEFFARVPKLLRERGYKHANLLIVTTNYDDLMERALQEAGEPYDLVSYIRDGENRGKFQHHSQSEGKTVIVHSANDYEGVSVDKRTVVLKIHGAVQRTDPKNESEPDRFDFVITEDNYINFLAQGDIAKRVPILLREQFDRCQFLFLGYGLADWNMRAFFNGVQTIQRSQNKRLRSWAVQLNPDEMEERFWDDRNVSIYDIHLGQYIRELNQRLEALPVRGNPR